MKRTNKAGFTLIELMIVVAIISILASVALPSYRNSIVRASRSAAQTQLLDLASFQEKIFLNSNAYTSSVTAAYTGNVAGGLGRTSGQTTDGKYALSLNIVVPSQTYILTATPIAGKSQVGDGNLSISESGQKIWGAATW